MRLATISADCTGLPSALAFSASSAARSVATERSAAISDSATSAVVSAFGFIAATCIATSLAAVSSPSNSTSTPIRVPCR